MDVLTKKPRKDSAKSAQSLDFGKFPQVNLLPLEIIEKRSLKVLQGRIILGFVGLCALVAVLFGGVQLEKSSAKARNDAAVAETSRLNAEKATYSEVPLVLNQIRKSGTALTDAMYREVLWSEYLGAVAATVPKDGVIKSFLVDAATANDAAPVPEDGLQEESVGAITFEATVPGVPDVSKWVNELNAIPGFADARISRVQYLDSDGQVFYDLTGTVRLTEAAYSGRFSESGEEKVGK